MKYFMICLITASVASVGDGLVSKTMPSFTKRRTQSSFKMYLDGIDESLIQSSLLTTTASPISMNIFSDKTITDPRLEAEILSDVSHVALDYTTFLSPNTAWIRFANVFGRILIISSDYIQDHYISPDEAFFQASMLAVSIQLLWRSAWPILGAVSKTSLSVRDRRAFSQLFSEVDLSVLQYKTLLASDTLEWVELSQGEQVQLDGDLYWIHSGEVKSSLQATGGSTGNDSLNVNHRMFGELHFAKALEEFRLTQKSKKGKSNKVRTDSSTNVVAETLTAGPNGAVVLRMCTPKLLKLMNHDDQLYDSINGLVLQCMQEKLSRTFSRANWKNSNMYQSNSSLSSPNVTMA